MVGFVSVAVVKIEDNRDDLKRSLRELLKRSVLVGVTEDTSNVGVQNGAINNAAKAYLNDNGAPEVNIPQREFMRPGIERASDELSGIFADAVRAQLAGNAVGVDAALNQAGARGQAAIVNEIDTGPLEPGGRQLSPVTLALRKEGRARIGDPNRTPFAGEEPLVETGALVQSITYVVE